MKHFPNTIDHNLLDLSTFMPICGKLAQTKPVFSNYVNQRHTFP